MRKLTAGYGRMFRNTAYIMKIAWKYGKKRVLHTVLYTLLKYVKWIFTAGFLMEMIVNGILNGRPYAELALWVVGIGVMFLLIALYNAYAENVLYPKSDIEMYRGIYSELFRKVNNVELRCFEQPAFYSQYTIAVENAFEMVRNTVTNLCTVVLGLAATLIVFLRIFSIDHIMVLFVLFPLCGNFVFGSVMNKVYYNRYLGGVHATRCNDYVNRLYNLADYAKDMRLSGLHTLADDIQDQAEAELKANARKYGPIGTLFHFLQTYFSFTVIFEGVMLYGAYCTIEKQTITLASITILTSIMQAATWILIEFSGALLKLSQNSMFIEKYRGFMEYDEKIPEDQEGLIPAEQIDTIEFRNVSFAYKQDEPVIQNLSFSLDLRKTPTVAIVGANGAGKSTIIKLLMRLYDPDAGEILVNGVDIRKYAVRSYRDRFAPAFQDHEVFSLPLSDNIMMGREVEDSAERVKAVLEAVDLYGKFASEERGTDTVLTREFDPQGAVLSGGQYQRVAVARALYNPAKLKIFDEPSSALDPIAEYKLFECIFENTADYPTIFISHRLASVRHTSLVLNFDGGTVIEQGTHDELMKQNRKYAQMFRMQSENYQVNPS